MSEMIERVAHAIAKSAFTKRSWEECLDDARAAIAAMRSPTSAMCNVGWNSGSVDPESIWEEMIDEALK